MESLNASLRSTPIAIIGKAGIFPKAHDVQEFWDNILQKIDAIIEVPPDRWRIEDYYDPDPNAPDKTYAKHGGFIPDVEFNPMEFGMPPNLLESTDVAQLLALVVARDVLTDAGYAPGDGVDHSRTGVVLGVTGGLKMLTPLTSRLQYPVWRRVLKSAGLSDEETEAIVERLKAAYVPWTENSFPGLLGNVIAGRIANRFDLGGTNATVDAACASSLAALQMSVSQLIEHRCDMMITGGVDADNSPFMFMCFSKTPAFSRTGHIRPFDAQADGTLVGEGLGMVVLKRLEDAERDGDRIYAVIRGIGSSSDGRYKSIYAPRPEGQARALRRAYEEAGFPPESVRLIEAHGTGTPAGDPAEVEALRSVFPADARRQYIALGSVKSQIGHLKGAAGAASLIKAALALHHKILPPTINVEQPNPKLKLEESAFYLNTEARPWINAEGATPRRAGVSAFGFGGTNFHVVLEEYRPEHEAPYRLHSTARALLFAADDPSALLATVEAALDRLRTEGETAFRALADASPKPIPQPQARLGFVADGAEEAQQLLQAAIASLRRQPEAESWTHPKGIVYRRAGMETAGKVVALFPGQGSQYLEMGREIANNFPPLRRAYARMDALFLADGLKPLSEVVFPIPAFDEATRKAQEAALRSTDYAQAAIGVTSAGLMWILQSAGFRPDFAAGHSFGELSALWAGGVLDDDGFFALVKARGKAMAAPTTDPDFDPGTMLAVKGAVEAVEAVLADHPDVRIANLNAPTQVVLAGPTAAIRAVAPALEARGLKTTPLSVSAAFHTPLVAHASEPFARAVAATPFHRARIPVYSNTTGDPYPDDPEAARTILANHILHTVVFKDQIEHIYEAGGRIFVEIGPRRVVTGLVEAILADKPDVEAVALNPSRKKSSDRQLREAVVRLQVIGLPLGEIDPWRL